MTLRFDTPEGPLTVEPVACTVAGWTGRDEAAVRHHIEELERIGVPAPSRTPLPYIVSPALLTQADTIHCVGAETSGEAEPAIVSADGRLWLTLASDHTDRALETHSVALSKQICAKPIAREAWRLDEIVEPDALTLRSWIVNEAGRETLYQDGTLASILPLDTVLDAAAPDTDGDWVMLCGTLPAIGGVRPALAMRFELNDPATDWTIDLAYRTEALPANA